MVKPLISIVTPTYNRESMLGAIHRCVLDQTYGNWEWVILDDSPQPSAYFLGQHDRRIRYHHAGIRQCVGDKRNWLNGQARGAIIAHVDDDEYYAPRYLEYMVNKLEAKGADLVKLSAFFIYSAVYDRFAYWDLTEKTGLHFIWSDQPIAVAHVDEKDTMFKDNHLGYGFSYVYLKTVWSASPFASVAFNEDAPFVHAALTQSKAVEFIKDEVGLCIHVLHAANTSACFPQYAIPAPLARTFFPGLPHTGRDGADHRIK